MASKYMSVKRIVIPFLTMLIIVAQITGCSPLNSKEAAEIAQETPEIVVEQADLDEVQRIHDLLNQENEYFEQEKQSEIKEVIENDEETGAIIGKTESGEIAVVEKPEVIDFDTFDEDAFWDSLMEPEDEEPEQPPVPVETPKPVETQKPVETPKPVENQQTQQPVDTQKPVENPPVETQEPTEQAPIPGFDREEAMRLLGINSEEDLQKMEDALNQSHSGEGANTIQGEGGSDGGENTGIRFH